MTWTGEWDTKTPLGKYTMKLYNPEGKSIVGTYEGTSSGQKIVGLINGSFAGTQLTGTWTRTNVSPHAGGPIALKLIKSGTCFEGEYTNQRDDVTREWTGIKS